ncbi:MAG: MoaD/ThiS family protein [Rubrivivax sp.]
MNIKVLYFASLREALGAGETVQVEAGATLASLRDQLIARSPRHAEVLSRTRLVRCALGHQLCDESSLIGDSSDGAEVAFFPPVTGG